MRPLSSVRILIVAAPAIPTAISTLALAEPGAGAYTCKALRGHNGSFGSSLALRGCTGPTGGSGDIPAPLLGPSTVTLAGGGTTTVNFTLRFPRRSKCPDGALEASLRGKVTVSTGPASGIKERFAAEVSTKPPNAVLSLLAGTRMSL